MKPCAFGNDAPPAPRKARRVTSYWSHEAAATVEDLKKFRKQARCVPDWDTVQTGDLVVVTTTSRGWHGRVCFTVYADGGSTLELKPVTDVQLSPNSLSAEISTAPRRGADRAFQTLKRCDVMRLPWPAMRRPPQPMTERHYLYQEWQNLSDKRFSPGRLPAAWDSMDCSLQRKYRNLSVAAIEVHQQICRWRLRMHALLKELLDVAPRPQVNAYTLYLTEKSKQRELQFPPWPEAKEEYQVLAVERNKKLKEMRNLYVEVLLGAGWSQQRCHLFPRSALRCMFTLLLCSRRTNSIAHKIPARTWIDHIFPYIPCYWFVKMD